MVDIDAVERRIRQYNDKAQTVRIDTSELVFELNTRINCFYCGRYANSWRCPPKIPEIDYRAMFAEFEFALIVYQSYAVTPENKKDVRVESSLSVHKTLLDAERFLYENNSPTALSFIGGSCKLCKSGCGVERCNNPYQARIPVEATGINLVKTMKNKGIDIVFPTDTELKRFGLLVWN